MLTAAQVLAANNFGNTRTGGLAGPMGLFLILVLAIVTVLLIRNMNSRLRRLPDRFPESPGEASRAEATAAEPADVSVAQESLPNAGKGRQQRRNG
ncbi:MULTISPECIES: hypothetical protein [Micromonospora]|uniref:Preprotein translocase subunit SecG n=1 Tax=Micromonospora yangpuensis TaxID=683228 RepID=A0A1C6U719_9ACTN|nr:hypothetical protein [Micromonospora yangpuensis]GGL90240.1 hypothetical protein GCM10012279_05000 [Micromonospora yangpuensis]SCL49885.1 hypothetical protein GA0070617_1316 [Micromonospora yangpuensis]